jgi:hypothetical protein
MDYGIFKGLRVKDDDLHINTKSIFCANLINGLNEELCEHYLPNICLSKNKNQPSKSNINKKKIIQEVSSFPNDKKNLDMKSRLKYLLSPDHDDKIFAEDLDSSEKPKVIK